MVDRNRYEISHSLSSGFDFYTGDEGLVISASLSSELNLIVSLTQEHFANSQLTASADLSTAARRITFASSAISIDGALVTVAVERKDALVLLSGAADLQVSGTKIAYAEISVDGDVSLSVSAIKQIFISSAISGDLTATADITKIIPIQSDISSNSNLTADSIKIAFASAQLDIDGVTVVVATERQDALVSISGSVDVQATMQKDSFGAASLSASADLAVNAIKEINIASSIDIDSSLSSQAIEILLAESATSGSVDVQAAMLKIAHAQAALEIDGFTLAVARERQDVSISINILSNIDTVITKDAFASSSLSINSLTDIAAIKIIPISSSLSASADVSATASEFVLASVSISGNSNVTASSVLVQYAAASLSGVVNLSVLGKIVLATIRITAIQDLNVTAKAIKFSSVTGIDTTSLRTILLLDGKPLTNQNRSLQISSIPIFVENNNWNGTSSRYYKNQSNADRKTFSLSWSFIPNFRENTVDFNHSRDFIRKAALDPDVHTLKIINQDASGLTPYTETTYNVFVKDFSENLVRRDLVDNVYYWDCSVVLEEV